MCTGLTLKTKDGYHLFGRSMDIEYSFNQAVHLVPRNFEYINVVTNTKEKTKFAMLGMGISIDNHPLLAEAFNEKGLGCAGLNFPGYAHYEEEVKEGMINLGVYDLILYILSNFEKVEDVKEAMKDVNIVNKEFKEGLQVPTLHWIVTDKEGKTIIIEKTKEGLKIFENNIGVLTNSPTFDFHITNLRQYIGLSEVNHKQTTWGDLKLSPLGQGLGLFGLPGDFSPPSRFVRASYLKSRVIEKYEVMESVREFFHILSNVSMINGSVITAEGLDDITYYKSCMIQEKGIYYYSTYNNSQINAIDMFKEDLDRPDMKIFEYHNEQSINYQN